MKSAQGQGGACNIVLFFCFLFMSGLLRTGDEATLWTTLVNNHMDTDNKEPLSDKVIINYNYLSPYII